LQLQAVAAEAAEQDNFQTVQQVSILIQQHRPHQVHLERMVKITPETEVVVEPAVVEPMAENQVMVDQETEVVRVDLQVQTQCRLVAQQVMVRDKHLVLLV
jgi:hypothetical protein